MKDIKAIDVVKFLDNYIVNQEQAKKFLAIAMRNRWRRLQIDDDIRNEIRPDNVLLIGSSGVGKSELVKRLVQFFNVPFVKIDAFLYTTSTFGENIKFILEQLVKSAMEKKTIYKGTDIKEYSKELIDETINDVQENGVVFIDDIDKLIMNVFVDNELKNIKEGIQRELLPLLEGATVYTSFGPISTDFILFIGAGAFNNSSPLDLIPSLQSRFSIVVELNDLYAKDFEKILLSCKYSLINQYIELFRTEGVKLSFSKNAIKKIAYYAEKANELLEYTGVKRLHSIFNILLEDFLFELPDCKMQKIKITERYVRTKLDSLFQNEDITKYIL